MSSSSNSVSMHEGTTEDRQNKDSTFTRRIELGPDQPTITWEQLRKYAEDHYNWIFRKYPHPANVKITHTRRGKGACIVAALFLPNAHGGVVFLSTIPEGSQKEEMAEKGRRKAPAWFAANANKTWGFHAEDSAIYNFEKSSWSTGVVQGGMYLPDATNLRYNRMRIVVWGDLTSGRGGLGRGRLVSLCDGEQGENGKKHPDPSCQDLAAALHIETYAWHKSEIEREQLEQERIRQQREEEERRRQESEEREMLRAAEEAERWYAQQRGSSSGHHGGGGYDQYQRSAYPPTSSQSKHSHHGRRQAASDPLNGAFNSLSIKSKSSHGSKGHSSHSHRSEDPKKTIKSAAPKTSSSSKSAVQWEWSKSQGKYYYMQGGKRVYAK